MRHAEAWALLTSETNGLISVETANILADIKRISEVVLHRRGQHFSETANEGTNHLTVFLNSM
jgi:hypothetical protein